MSGRPRTPSSDKPRTPFARRVQELRLQHKMTQVDLAVAVGLTRAHIAKIETGDDSASAASLAALAHIFGTSMDFLYRGAHPRPPAPTVGRVVDQPEELAVLDLWRAIPADHRARVIRMIAAAAEPEPPADPAS